MGDVRSSNRLTTIPTGPLDLEKLAPRRGHLSFEKDEYVWKLLLLVLGNDCETKCEQQNLGIYEIILISFGESPTLHGTIYK